MADSPVRRIADLVHSGGASDSSSAEECRRPASVAVALRAVRRGNRPVLRRRPHLGAAYPSFHRRVLALVGGPPVGGRLLRSLRHHGDRVLLHAAETDPSGFRRQGRPALRQNLYIRRNHRALSSSLLLWYTNSSVGV